MNKYKKIFFILFIMFMTVINQACTFPDVLPDLSKLKIYSPDKMDFGKTTIEKFKSYCQKIPDTNIENYTDGITIIKLNPTSNDIYKLIRVGFKDGKLDWIEFNLAYNIKISKLISIYGTPTDLNDKYNNDLNYYNYDFFNISGDKTNKTVKSITYFNKPLVKPNEVNKTKFVVTEKNKKKFFEKFPNIEPAITTESDFSAEYPNIIPYEDNKSETNSIYVLRDELEESSYYYERAILKFESGLLTWINLIPQKLTISACLKNIKTPYKKENIDSAYELYDFSSFILVVDKKTKTVKSIGIFSKNIDI